MTKEEFSNMHGTFTWMFDYHWFIETTDGNFVWSDKRYPGGNNTVRRFSGTYEKFLKLVGFEFGRDKGYRLIGPYISEDGNFDFSEKEWKYEG